MFLGSEHIVEFMKPEKIMILGGLPLQNSVFGYIAMCRLFDNLKTFTGTVQVSSNSIELEKLHNQIQQFWTIENVSSPNNFSLKEKMCERHYTEYVTRDKCGRYTVSLPVKEKIECLEDTSKDARNQFFSL